MATLNSSEEDASFRVFLPARMVARLVNRVAIDTFLRTAVGFTIRGFSTAWSPEMDLWATQIVLYQVIF